MITPSVAAPAKDWISNLKSHPDSKACADPAEFVSIFHPDPNNEMTLDIVFSVAFSKQLLRKPTAIPREPTTTQQQQLQSTNNKQYNSNTPASISL